MEAIVAKISLMEAIVANNEILTRNNPTHNLLAFRH